MPQVVADKWGAARGLSQHTGPERRGQHVLVGMLRRSEDPKRWVVVDPPTPIVIDDQPLFYLLIS